MDGFYCQIIDEISKIHKYEKLVIDFKRKVIPPPKKKEKRKKSTSLTSPTIYFIIIPEVIIGAKCVLI